MRKLFVLAIAAVMTVPAFAASNTATVTVEATVADYINVVATTASPLALSPAATPEVAGLGTAVFAVDANVNVHAGAAWTGLPVGWVNTIAVVDADSAGAHIGEKAIAAGAVGTVVSVNLSAKPSNAEVLASSTAYPLGTITLTVAKD